jgi:hypothetical protein
LRSALSRLLRSGAEGLLVMNGELPIGVLTLDNIRTSAEERASL